MGEFVHNMDRLARQVRGRWSARCEVDQVYAHYQEVHPEFDHPDGGQAFYLRDSVYLGNWVAHVARGLIDHYGVGIETKMIEVSEGIAAGVYRRAPVEFYDLRRSGRPYVTRDGATVYNRPAMVGRLSAGDLRLKHRISYLFEPHRYRRS